MNLGVLEKANLFAQFVIVERDLNDATRLNAYLPIDVVNHLRVFAGNVTTFLQYLPSLRAASELFCFKVAIVVLQEQVPTALGRQVKG